MKKSTLFLTALTTLLLLAALLTVAPSHQAAAQDGSKSDFDGERLPIERSDLFAASGTCLNLPHQHDRSRRKRRVYR